MRLSYDPPKDARNRAERNLPFSMVKDLDWKTCLIAQDTRHPYPEPRFNILGFIGKRMHVICITPLEDGVHIISLRKANEREIKEYKLAAADKSQLYGAAEYSATMLTPLPPDRPRRHNFRR